MPIEISQLIISGLFSLCGALVGVVSTSRLTNYRLEQLEKKVDKLSDNDRRLALLEQRLNSYEEKS